MSSSVNRVPKSGNEFAFSDEDMSPVFHIDTVDAEGNMLHGRAIIPVPVGCQAIFLHVDNERQAELVYRKSDGSLVNVRSNLADNPDEIRDWDIDCPIVETKISSNP